MPRTGPVFPEKRVDFADIFGADERDRLRRKTASLSTISKEGGRWRAHVVQPCEGRRQGFLRPTGKNDNRQRRQLLGRKLLSAYVARFRSQDEAGHDTSDAGHKGHHQDDNDNLKDATAFRVAAAMDLAGACRLEQPSGQSVSLKATRSRLDDKVISRVDELVNVSPPRLAYAFLAAGRRIPRGYLERVLRPWARDRLVEGTGCSDKEAEAEVARLCRLLRLDGDQALQFEPLMELRNRLDAWIARRQPVPAPAVTQAPVTRPSPEVATGGHTAAQLLSRGRLSQRRAQKFAIAALVRSGVAPDKARQQVADAVRALQLAPGKPLPVRQFRQLLVALSLSAAARPRYLVEAWIRLVDSLDDARPAAQDRYSLWLLQRAGISPQRRVSPGMGVAPLRPPRLEAPEPKLTYSCDEDELWYIRQQVDQGHRWRFTKDMARRLLRWMARNKRRMASEAVTHAATTLVTGLVSGGPAAGVYLGGTLLFLPVMLACNYGGGLLQLWWHRRKVRQFDQQAGNRLSLGREDNERRKAFHQDLAYLVSEKSVLDCFNAYANMEQDLAGSQQLAQQADQSVAGQIAWRRREALQQLRAAQLGEAFRDFDRMMVETMTEISQCEARFTEAFDLLWQPFAEGAPGMTRERRQAIFDKAARRVLAQGPLRLVTENSVHWLHQLVARDADKTAAADKTLCQALGGDAPLDEQALRKAGHKARAHWLAGNSLEAARYSARMAGSFVSTHMAWHMGGLGEKGMRWLTGGVVPHVAEVAPVPTAAVVVYWASRLLTGRLGNLVNDCLNRARVRKIVAGRKDSQGRERSFDGDFAALGQADWRALSREARAGIKKLPDLLARLRREHNRLDEDLRRLAPSYKDVLRDSDDRLVERATLILRRKHLESQIQALLSGAVGTLYQEMIRGEWRHRQVFDSQAPSSGG